jgi:hypothetical protein
MQELAAGKFHGVALAAPKLPNPRASERSLDFPLMADFVAKVFLHWRSKILLAVDAIFM